MPSATTIFSSRRSETIRPSNGKIDSIKHEYIDRSYETRCILDPSGNLHHFEFLESCPISKYKHRKRIIVQYVIDEFPFPLPRDLTEI